MKLIFRLLGYFEFFWTIAFFTAFSFAQEKEKLIHLTDLDISVIRQSWGKPQINISYRNQPLSIAGEVFTNGIATHAISVFWINLNGNATRFQAKVGLDDSANGPGSIIFKIYGDQSLLWQSEVIKPKTRAVKVDIPINGITNLLLFVGDANNVISFDHADWADATISYSGNTPPKAIIAPKEDPVILTPKPSIAPKINGPKIYGCKPGRPFIFRIPTQGKRPMKFEATGLPKSLNLDESTGIITGTAPETGKYLVKIHAKNEYGSDTSYLTISSGDKLALTPPMGWNHWYAHYNRITDAMIRQAADIIVSSGMADVGYQYVNIDDCWMNTSPNNTVNNDINRIGPARDNDGNIIPNKHFPNMKALTDYIHSKGLKAGIYSSPGPLTCAGFTGSYQHEQQDAELFAKWGFDFLKYDWCSYGEIAKNKIDLQVLKKPYKLMGDILKNLNRDIVFNLCQYGMGNVWEWGSEVNGQSWRTSGDLGFELHQIFEVAIKNCELRQWCKPGAWNDPDYIQIGFIGNAHAMGEPKPCPLTPSEQYAFMSLWCLMSAPIFYSGDLSKLDAFTINVLCNPEVIAINQDELGKCAKVIKLSEDTFLLVKHLSDGSKAVGLCNKGETPANITASWSDIGISGTQLIRDLWRQSDLGIFNNNFAKTVNRRSVYLVKLSPVNITSTHKNK